MLQLPESAVKPKIKHIDNWPDVLLSTLLKSGLEVVPTSYIGV